MFRKPEPPHPLRDAIARHLRFADDLTRKGKYEDAILEIEKALKIDPKNNNARQFYQRVQMFYQKSQDQQKAKEATHDFNLEQRMELIPRFLAIADQHIAQHDYKGALAQIAEIYKIDPMNYYAQAYSDKIDQLMSEAQTSKRRGVEVSLTPAPVANDAPIEESGSLMFYRELLKEYWFDGKLTEKEQAHLAEVREIFQISMPDHERLSREVRSDAYVDALRLAWIDGILTETERKVLETMRAKYGISPEEHARAEELGKSVRMLHPNREVVLIIDQDREHSVAIAKVLKARGYNPMMAGRPHDAYNYLQKNTPAAIISETKFEDVTMDGFELYRRVRNVPAMARIPYIFVVKLRDKDMLHAALRIGVDHVLDKPADPEFIAAVLEGKRVL